MQDRFKFNAVVSSYYDIDTTEEYKEVEPQFYLKNVDVFCTGEIGIDYDTLLETVKEQAKDLTKKEIGQIMQHFEDNSNSPECDFVTIKPDKIMQSTGLKDKNGKLIYEGDIVKTIYNRPDGVIINRNCVIEYNRGAFWINYGIGASYLYNDDCIYEVIGNRYENIDLLGVKNEN